MNKILYGALGAFFISFPMQAKILVYPRIEDRAVVDDGRYKVYVREAGTENAWRELQVFSVEVDMDTRSRAAMAQFDADEPVEVKVVTLGQMADNVKIRPLSQGISYGGRARLDVPLGASGQVECGVRGRPHGQSSFVCQCGGDGDV